MPLFTARLEHFDHLHGPCLSPAELSVCHCSPADVCMLAATARRLPEAVLARRGKPHRITCDDQTVSGPAPCFHVGGLLLFLNHLFFFFWQNGDSVLGTPELLPSLIVLCKKAHFLCFLITHSLEQSKQRILQ